ncbi:uncharacterized protein LOC135460628 [Zonotrichia leucophrys gambelii]|uniref:uncharacterized protein LOC135460628 n=1 Tax=Zonotrichia leucophrys gambelii TaxID=257770 RepID=UPI0031409FD4
MSFRGHAVSPNSLPVSDVPALVSDPPHQGFREPCPSQRLRHHAGRSSCCFQRHFHVMFPVLGQSPTTRHFWPCSRTSEPPNGCLGVSAYQDCCAEIPQLPSVTALKLAESLLPHFENDNSHVQLLSIQLFYKVMELVVEEGEELLTAFVNQSLLPLFLRWHDENLYVAKASFQALLCAACFLRRMDLEELLMKARWIKFAESLLLQNES